METKRTGIYVILAVALLLSGSLLTQNVQSAEDGTLSFISNHEGKSELYLMDSTGGNVQKLETNKTKKGGGHTWSPDGRFFAYISREIGKTTIHVMDIRTKEFRPLIDHPSRNGSPAWSPNGKWIAFTSNRTKDWQIYRIDVDGSNLKQLTNKGDNGGPAWSPDSQWIVYDSYRGGNHDAGARGRHFLYRMDADGRRSKQLREDHNFLGCTWSPNGKQIAFAVGNLANEGVNISVIDINGGNLRKLTQGGAATWTSHPEWSPDGQWIAYAFKKIVRWPGPGERLPVDEVFSDGAIYVVNVVDGGAPVEIINGLSQGATPAWVPENFLPVAPSTRTQMTLWGKLKQTNQ